jgi:hypothetical protein
VPVVQGDDVDPFFRHRKQGENRNIHGLTAEAVEAVHEQIAAPLDLPSLHPLKERVQRALDPILTSERGDSEVTKRRVQFEIVIARVFLGSFKLPTQRVAFSLFRAAVARVGIGNRTGDGGRIALVQSTLRIAGADVRPSMWSHGI